MATKKIELLPTHIEFGMENIVLNNIVMPIVRSIVSKYSIIEEMVCANTTAVLSNNKTYIILEGQQFIVNEIYDHYIALQDDTYCEKYEDVDDYIAKEITHTHAS